MQYNNQRSPFTCKLRLVFFIIIMASLYACASSPEPAAQTGEAAAAGGEAASSEAADTGTESSAAAGDSATETATTATADSAPKKTATAEAEQPKAPPIVESCKDEPYIKYEQQARDSIAKGLQATKADKFGVGFRDVKEHNKWSKIHSKLFEQVNKACSTLSDCAKQHPKDKITECHEQAQIFQQWQQLAKGFAEKAKSAETTQPPEICSLTPNLSEPARCFHGLADNIDKVCDSKACKETSDCWDGVGFLDAAITQARRSCGFVHEDLSNCRGYVEATARRKKKFEQCQDLQGRLNVTIFPVL